MRTLSAATIAEAALTVTRPGYLIQIGYSTMPLMLCVMDACAKDAKQQ